MSRATRLNARVGSVDVATRYARSGGTKVANLTYPVRIAHRCASNIYPENTLVAAEMAAGTVGIDLIEYDVIAGSDGTLVVMHDSTIDRTTTGSGNTADLNAAGARLTVLDASVWHGGRFADITGVPLLSDVLTRVGSRKVHLIEVKDGLDATATLICDMVVAFGLQDYVIIQSFVLSNLAVVRTYGLPTQLNAASADYPATTYTPAALVAAGVSYAAIDTTYANTAAYIAGMHAVGIKVFGYVVNGQMTAAAAMALGYDGLMSNDPNYSSANYAQYRSTKTKWHLNGTWGAGMTRVNITSFTLLAVNRGSFVSGPYLYRWQPTNSQWLGMGSVNPAPSPAGSYTVDIVFGADVIPTTTTEGPTFAFCAPSDEPTIDGSSNIRTTYTVKARANGTINLFAIDAAGAVTGKGTLTTGAWVAPVTSGTLTAGTAYTSIPVAAIPSALKTGNQFYLPNGQIATLTADAAVSATSLTVSSITPLVTVASGTTLAQRITVRLTISPTSIAVFRPDEPSVSTVTNADATYRGAYLLQIASMSGAARISLEYVQVA